MFNLVRSWEKALNSPYFVAAGLAGIIGPLSILLHEVGGHWLIAKLLGAKNMSLGYSQVDCGTANSWSPMRQVPVHAGGPILTNLFILVGLKLLETRNLKSKLFGWALVLPAYRGLTIPLRQISEIETGDFLTDESLVAQGVGVSKFLVSLPQTIFSGWVMFKGYCLLQEHSQDRRLVLLSAFLGHSLGTLIYLKLLGPLLFPQSVNFFDWFFRQRDLNLERKH